MPGHGLHRRAGVRGGGHHRGLRGGGHHRQHPPGGVHRLEIPAAVVPAADAGIFRQHRAEGVAALYDLADRGVCPAAGGDGHPLETGGLRPGGQGVRLRLEGEFTGGPGHGLPGRGGADRGQQGGCHWADARGVLRAGDHYGGGVQHVHAHRPEAGLPEGRREGGGGVVASEPV